MKSKILFLGKASLFVTFFFTLATSLQAGVSFSQNQHELIIAPGFNHVPISIPYSPDTLPYDESVITVSSDVSWAIPAVNTADDSIYITFATESLIASYTATITIDDGDSITELFISANVSPLDIYRFLDDPQRSKTYGIQRNGIDEGCIIAYDPVNQTPIECLTVGRSPTDFVINDDSTELLVINSVSQTIDVIDLTTFTLKETILLPTYSAWGDDDDTTANIELGANDIIYYVDGSWGPVLHVLQRSTNTVLQSMIFNGLSPTNSTGFMDFAVTSDKTKMIAMPQYGWSAGGHSSIIAHYTINPDGTVNYIKSTTVNGFAREPFEAPVLVSNDDQIAVMKTIAADPANSDNLLRSFPSAIWSMTPNGAIVATGDKIYEYATGNELYTIPNGSNNVSGYIGRRAQAFTSDYTRFIHFNPSSRSINVVNLINTIGLELLGRTLSPAHGSVVNSPTEFVWSPISGVDQYDLYLGTDSAAVGAAGNGSPLYLGRITGTRYALQQTLNDGTDYFWRIDPVTIQGPEQGTVYSFTVSDIAIDQTEIDVQTIVGHANFPVDISLSSGTPGLAWSASASDNWVTFTQDTGTTPATLKVHLDASVLAPGFHTSTITITSPAGQLLIPVHIEVEGLNLVHIRNDRNSDIAYAISEDTGAAIPRAYLLEIDTTTESILRVVRVGSSVTDVSIHYPDNFIYVTNWRDGNLLEVDLATLTVNRSIAFTPAGATGHSENDVYRVAAGVSGRIVVEEEDQWIDISLINTQTDTELDTYFVREGGGAFDPTGRYYYHGDNNSSGAGIQKYDIAGDAFIQLVSLRPSEITSYYGSRVITISEDGSRIFWAGVVLDSDLNTVWPVGENVYSTTDDGRYAFCNTAIFDVNLRRQVLQMPVSTNVSGFNSTSNKLMVQEGGEIKFYPLTSPITLPAPVLSSSNATATTVTLDWTDNSLETQFNIQQKLSSSSIWTDTQNTVANTVTFTANGLQDGQSYDFRIRASSSEFSSSWSNIVTVTTPAPPPSTPTLSIPVPTMTSIQLSWTDSSDETGYELESSPNGTDIWTVVATLGANTTSYTDSPLAHSTTFYYRVRAVKNTVASSYSSIRSATTLTPMPPATPASLSASVVSSSLLEVTWPDVQDEDGYQLERKTDSTDWTRLTLLSPDVTSYSDSNVVIGVTYTYRIFAYNSIGSSAYSNESSATPSNLITLLSDNFDPNYDSQIWQTVSESSSVQGSPGFLGSKALWFNSSGTRQATTVPLDLSQGGMLTFKMRAGNQSSDGSTYWNNSESGENVVLEYSTNGGSTWANIQSIDSVYPSLSTWTDFSVNIPVAAKSNNVQLRWRQLSHSGSGFDQWAIDDLNLQVFVAAPPPPPFIIVNANSASEVAISWEDSTNAATYVIERQTLGSSWVQVAEVIEPQTYFTDINLTPSTIYIYRVKARNGGGDSAYTNNVVVQTWSSLLGWLIEHFGTVDQSEIQNQDPSQTPPLLRYAFNIGPYQTLHTLVNNGTSGMPRPHIVNGYLCIEFVRRCDASQPSITYVTEFSNDLINWTPYENQISLDVIDSTWERVIMEDSVPVSQGRYARVRVTEN